MITYFDRDIPSNHVVNAFNKTVRAQPALLADWLPGQLRPSASAKIIRKDAGRFVANTVAWGRSGRQGDLRYTDSSSASMVRRGLLPVTGFVMAEEFATRSWEARQITVTRRGQPFFMVGVALNPSVPDVDFSILTVRAGADLRSVVHREPLVVPESRWAEFLNPESASDFNFPPPPGTFQLRMPAIHS